jgi:hypothetical protein
LTLRASKKCMSFNNDQNYFLRYHIPANFLVGVVVSVFFSLLLHGQSLEDFLYRWQTECKRSCFPDTAIFSPYTISMSLHNFQKNGSMN